MVRGLPLAFVQGGAHLTQPTLREAQAPQTDDGCSLFRQFLGLVPGQMRDRGLRQMDTQIAGLEAVRSDFTTPLAQILKKLRKGSSSRDATSRVHHLPTFPSQC